MNLNMNLNLNPSGRFLAFSSRVAPRARAMRICPENKTRP
jgi:hypothetical protein